MMDLNLSTTFIGVEPIPEYKVDEIKYDGTEIIKHPLSFDDYIKKLSNQTSVEDNKVKDVTKSPLNPDQEAIIEKLRNALTEINVLVDVLKITKQQQYLALDYIANESSDLKTTNILNKKKNLLQASAILANGFDRLRSDLTTSEYKNDTEELFALRSFWKIKKVKEKIYGDLSLKSIGSTYFANGTFEVKKDTSAKSNNQFKIYFPKNIDTTPLHLHINIKNFENGEIFSTNINLASNDSVKLVGTNIQSTSTSTNQTLINKTLESIQNNIFYQEILYSVGREALENNNVFEYNPIIKPNFFSCPLFGKYWVEIFTEKCQDIDLRHQPISNESKDIKSSALSSLNMAIQSKLLQQFQTLFKVAKSVPSCANISQTNRRRLAGPHCLRYDDTRCYGNPTNVPKHPRPLYELQTDLEDELLLLANTSSNGNNEGNVDLSFEDFSLLDDGGRRAIHSGISTPLQILSNDLYDEPKIENDGKNSEECAENQLPKTNNISKRVITLSDLVSETKERIDAWNKLEPLYVEEMKPLKLERSRTLKRYYSTKVLKPLVDMCKHFLLLKQTQDTIHKFIIANPDPLMVVHTASTNDITHSSININIVSQKFEAICRTSLCIQINIESLKVVMRDGRVIWLNTNPDSLYQMLAIQISQHQINGAQSLAKFMGWQTIANDAFSGATTEEPFGNKSTLTLRSPNDDCTMHLEYGPVSGPKITIYIDEAVENSMKPTINESNYCLQNKKNTIRIINPDNIPSKIFIEKIEYLMALFR